MRRRNFLQIASSALATSSMPAIAREAFNRSGGPRFQLGLAAYSLRNYFSFSRGKKQEPAQDGKRLDMYRFIDYCVEQGLDAAELTSYFFDPAIQDETFLDIKRYAFVRGVAISGTAIGNNFTIGAGPKLDEEIAKAMTWIDRASLLGAPHIRFFAGTGKQLQQDPKRMDEACAAIEKCALHAAQRGVFIGIENHGNLTSDQMLQIMDRVKNPWVGINLDTGNFWSDDPYGDLEKCAPYAVNVQVKVSMKKPNGEHYPADLNRVGKILKEASYQGYVVLEYEDADPYKNIPASLNSLRQSLSM
jgi:sugar phosphate isomerase/epimerase